MEASILSWNGGVGLSCFQIHWLKFSIVHLPRFSQSFYLRCELTIHTLQMTYLDVLKAFLSRSSVTQSHSERSGRLSEGERASREATK